MLWNGALRISTHTAGVRTAGYLPELNPAARPPHGHLEKGGAILVWLEVGKLTSNKFILQNSSTLAFERFVVLDMSKNGHEKK